MIFNTGLTQEQFAKQKLSFLLTLKGCIVKKSEDGFYLETWQAESVREENGLMFIHGPDFSGDRLDKLFEKKEAVIPALFLWKNAAEFLLEKDFSQNISTAPAAVFIDIKNNAVFFPPRDLCKIAVETEGEFAWLNGALRWFHPDKKEQSAVDFTFAAFLYRAFSDEAPFNIKTELKYNKKPLKKAGREIIEDTLFSDLREGSLIKAEFAAPGLKKEIADFINAQIINKKAEETARHYAVPKIDFTIENNFNAVSDAEKSRITAQKNILLQKKEKQILRKRFLIRNRALLTGAAIGFAALCFIVFNFIDAQLSRWNTKGLSPAEVAAVYYSSFGKLEHEKMSACTADNAGKDDIDTVTNLFVVSKMREAYEQRRTVIDAAEWDPDAQVPSDITVFGVRDFKLNWLESDEADGKVTALVNYTLVVPSSFGDSAPQDAPQSALQSGDDTSTERAALQFSRSDKLTLTLLKDRWRITRIERAD